MFTKATLHEIGKQEGICNIVILYILRKFGILLLYIYEGNCVSKMFLY